MNIKEKIATWKKLHRFYLYKMDVYFVGELLTHITQLEQENERLRGLGAYMYDEAVEDEGGLCKCYQYDDALGAPKTLCSLCAWRDALSKES